MQGFPSIARDKLKEFEETPYKEMSPGQQQDYRSLKEWLEAATGQEGEFKACQMLHRIFAKEPGLLLTSFKESSLWTLAKSKNPDEVLCHM